MKIVKKFAALSLSAATAFGTFASTLPVQVMATETSLADDVQGVESFKVTDNVVDITFKSGLKGKLTFLEEGIFRWNVDPSDAFSAYAKPNSASHTGRIQAQPDTSDIYTKPTPTAVNNGGEIVVSTGATQIIFDEETGAMKIMAGDKVILEEASPLQVGSSGTVQTLVKNEGEHFYGGGTQNGRINHTGSSINIKNESSWTDGGVSSPNPFYWSTNGYGVLRNTFAQGVYDFGSTSENVKTTHSENEFDAYFFVSAETEKANITQDLLQKYFAVTGSPVLLPEYGFYLGHLNCYNRDGWSEGKVSGGQTWTIKGDEDPSVTGKQTTEFGQSSGYVVPDTLSAESLNGTAPTVNAEKFVAKDTPEEFSARSVIDDYQEADVPFSWFLPNDGYGCGYGQNGYELYGGTDEERAASLLANVENLGEFTKYANERGISTGLWTQSNLTPIATEKQHLQRDFEKEVTIGGVTTLKTDVAWVGSGYSMALDATRQAYETVTTTVEQRPNIITLDGWAGTQRFASIWTGDQYGGNWEYIRFHIPTYIGQSLSGNPNIGSDMDGIFGGNAIIATRDYQWKAFTPQMLDMDGWGSYAKTPFTHGDPFTGISRMYLKLKAQLMPYVYTTAASAANVDTNNGDTGLPMIRAMMLEDDSNFAASDATMYQYMWGDSFLVAPVYQDTAADEDGNDIRNNIYLPGDEDTIWIDYFTGDQYRGGQVLNDFDAPLWKLPLFVRNGSIIPMYEENNNPEAISETNPDGLDKTNRIIEFYPYGETSYTLYEDDGHTAINNGTVDEEYGLVSDINYGGEVLTTFTSKVDEEAKTATLTAGISTGSYEGYNSVRNTQFNVAVSEKPSGVDINGEAGTEVSSLEAFKALGDNESGWFYEENAAFDTYAVEGSGFAELEINVGGRVYVKFAKTDVAKNEQTAVIKGFVNDGDLPADKETDTLSAPVLTAEEDLFTPTSISLSWTSVEGAESYEILADGILYSTTSLSFLHEALDYDSEHTYQIRSRNEDGYSAWSEELICRTLLDPWRNVPEPANLTWEGGYYAGHTEDLAFDRVFQGGGDGFHSDSSAIDKALTIDYGLVYQFETLEYYPGRAGNGTVTQMEVSTSLDGKHWNVLPIQEWEYTADMKEVELNTAARYIRLVPKKAAGNFFAAVEIAAYKKDGTKGFALGSSLMMEEVSEGDLTNLQNYKGIENKEPYQSEFNSQIKDHYADINNNGVYDIYDYSFTLFSLDGGTKKTGAPSGALLYLADKTEVAEGDIVTISLYGSDVVNANALGGLFRFDNDAFEMADSNITGSPYLRKMENLSIVRSFDDGTSTVNIAFANRGNKNTYSGSDVLATFQLKAKKSGTVSDLLDLNQTTMLIGPEFDVIETEVSRDIEIPNLPAYKEVKLKQNDLSLAITNETYTEDDGTNVTKMIQQGSWDGLFDGGQTDRNFELIWTVVTDKFGDGEHLKMPVTLHFGLNNPEPVSRFELYAGALTSNGAVQKLKATVNFANGTKTVFEGGDYDVPSTHYSFVLSDEEQGKAVESIEVTILETKDAAGENDNKVLTLCEMEIYALEGKPVSSIEAVNPVTELAVGEIAVVHANVLPEEAINRYYTVSSSNEEVAAVEGLQFEDSIVWLVKALSEGATTLTFTAAGDENVTVSYELTVSGSVSTAELEALVAQAEAIPAHRLTDASAKALEEAIAEAKGIIGTNPSKGALAEVIMNLQDVMGSLSYTKPAEDHLINKTAEDGVEASYTSSECDTNLESGGAYGWMTLDKDEETYWHSNWSNGDVMPQYIVYDLGDVYNLSDVSFLPRQNGYNGDIFEVELYSGLSADELEYIGTFSFEKADNGYQLKDRDEWKTMTFAAREARFVKFNVTKSGGDSGNNKFCSMSEIKFYYEDKAVEPEVPVEISYEALKSMITKAEDVNLNDYEDDTAMARFKAAYANAVALINNAADQAEVDAAAEELRVSMALLNPVKPDEEDNMVIVYRAYNPNDGDHLYTTHKREFDNAIEAGWNNEGTGWVSVKESGVPVYRVYDKNSGEHHYTKDEHEVRTLVTIHGWRYENIAWYSDEEETVDVFRLYNPNAKGAGRHHYTHNEVERDFLVKEGWKLEGVGFHAIAKG